MNIAALRFSALKLQSASTEDRVNTAVTPATAEKVIHVTLLPEDKADLNFKALPGLTEYTLGQRVLPNRPVKLSFSETDGKLQVTSAFQVMKQVFAGHKDSDESYISGYRTEHTATAPGWDGDSDDLPSYQVPVWDTHTVSRPVYEDQEVTETATKPVNSQEGFEDIARLLKELKLPDAIQKPLKEIVSQGFKVFAAKRKDELAQEGVALTAKLASDTAQLTQKQQQALAAAQAQLATEQERLQANNGQLNDLEKALGD